MKFWLACLVIFVASLFGEETAYRKEPDRWTVNYGQVPENAQFPYHPAQEEYEKAMEEGAEVSLDVVVVDEEGNPLEGATVTVELPAASPGKKAFANFDRKTDEKGEVHVEENCGGRVVLSVVKDGYYGSLARYLNFFHKQNYSLKDGRWQPWGVTHKVVLRPIRNPVPMYPANGVLGKWFEKVGKPLGVDLFLCDFVKPYGQGKTADLFLQYDLAQDEEGKTESLTITFPNKGDGVYRRRCFEGSMYNTDYTASTDDSAYESKMVLHRKVKYEHVTTDSGEDIKKEQVVSENLLGEQEYLVFRTRTRRNLTGRVVSCHYSKTLRHFDCMNARIHMEWNTNPTPNDANLEEDLQRRYDPKAAKRQAKKAAEAAAPNAQKKRQEERLARRKLFEKNPGAPAICAVDDYLDALLHGEKEAAAALVLANDQKQKDQAERFLAKAIPFFSSGKVESAVEPIAFLLDGCAIVPIRQWHAGAPEAFEMEITCLVKSSQGDKWLLLPNFERPNAPVNGLDETARGKFATLNTLYDEYKTKRMAERKAP